MTTFKLVNGKLQTIEEQLKLCTSVKVNYKTYLELLNCNLIEVKVFHIGIFDEIKEPLICISFYHFKHNITIELNNNKINIKNKENCIIKEIKQIKNNVLYF